MLNNWKEFWNKNKRNILSLLLLCAILFPINMMLLNSIDQKDEEEIEKIEYTEFIELLEAGAVDTLYYNNNEEWMTATLWNDESRGLDGKEREEYEYKPEDMRQVLYPAYDEFRKDMLEYDIRLVLERTNSVGLQLLNSVLSLAFPIALLVIMMKSMSRMTGKGVDPKTLLQTSDVRFSDVIGQDEVLDDVRFITSLLRNRELGTEVGAKVPKGLLLAGAPGTGKTLIAKAIAGEAEVPFIYVNSSSLIEMFVGVGAKRVRDIFQVARKNAPCIVFFDEIDSIGIKRDSRGSTSENDQTINALLQEMDGFSGREGVFIIAATNRADKLDSALVRAGRFDRKVDVMPPRDWKVREQLFRFYLGKFRVFDDVDIENVARQVGGFTGADIAAVCNEASIIAVMHGKSAIDMACLEEAIDKKIFHGNRSKKAKHEKDTRIVAYHEAGHAVAHILLGESITRASIQSMNSGVGGVVFGEDTDSQFRTKDYYENRVMICYAGRVVEKLVFDSVTQGASSDIAQATQLLYEYIANLGYSEDFGMLNMDVLAEKQLMTGTPLFDMIQKKSKELYERTEVLIDKNIGMVDTVAKALIERETMTGNELLALLERTESNV